MRRVEIRGARDDHEIDLAYDLAARTFGPSYFETKDAKVRLRALEPIANPSDAVIALHAGEVIGFVRIVDRLARLGDRALPVGGITSVSVHPDYRGHGLGRDVMEAAVGRSRERGDALSIAYARRAVDGFYWRLGYLGIGCHPDLSVQTRSVERDAAVSARAGHDGRFADLYRRAYADSYGDLPMSFERGDTWWRTLPERLAHLGSAAGHGLFTVFSSEAAVGYFVAHNGRIIEAASAPGARASVMRAMLTHGAGSDVRIGVPAAHWAIAMARPLNHTLSVRHAWDGGHVVRVVDNGAFCDALVSAGADDRSVDDLRGVDVSDHTAARGVLERVAGIDLPGSTPLLRTLPSWSTLDEF
jgi:ribosomal protein S18 acetylase RimI-like enzyme